MAASSLSVANSLRRSISDVVETRSYSSTVSRSADPRLKRAGTSRQCRDLTAAACETFGRRMERLSHAHEQRSMVHATRLAIRAGSKSKELVALKLKMSIQVQFGESLAVAGSSKWLGSWHEQKDMAWSESGWTLDVRVKPGDEAEFKFLIKGTHGGTSTTWEEGPNRKLKIPGSGEAGAYELQASWSQIPELEALSAVSAGAALHGEPEEAKEARPTNGAATVGGGRNEGKHLEQEEEESRFLRGWQGKEATFMRSNEHSSERRGKWSTEGLQGAGLKLVEGDKSAGNWWRKLEVVRSLVDSSEGGAHLDALVHSAVYLQWISTGQIVCVEDGGHHRPNKHAEIARQIFRVLERDSVKPGVSPEELLVARKIHPNLPSFTAEFTASVPLTRIRDIAHRNDIPHDLKQEIKHTIQNKLHRNAGPEDLVATNAMLKRVTAPGASYSQDFVEQLRIFYRELKDFFNAASLTDQLAALRGSFDDSATSALSTFLEAKERADAGDGTDKLIGALHALTGLRALLLKGLESGLRNDASDDAIAMRQKWRLAEIGLENYSFVLLSRFINALEASGGASTLATEATSGNTAKWAHALGATVLGVRQLGLSGWQRAECVAIENEISAWQSAQLPPKASEDATRVWALRLKATLDRTRRLAETYTETILKLFPSAAKGLGLALDVPDNTINTFAEADIRASVVFQLAKLCSLLLKSVRAVTGGGGWDSIMTGSAIGRLVQVERITPGAMPAEVATEVVVLLVNRADGDEEVKAAGGNVAGIVLCQELPHLSHLGVRARQEGVVFVTCEDEDRLAELRALNGKAVKLEATPEAVDVSEFDGKLPRAEELASVGVAEAVKASEASSSTNRPVATGAKQSKAINGSVTGVLELSEADVQTCGAKAAACGQLAILAEKAVAAGKSTAFRVPAGASIPFGAMDDALSASGSSDEFASLVERSEKARVEGGELDSVCERLRELVAAQKLPEASIQKIAKTFPADAKLIVRSSANVEDLEGMSGAGLYDSIPNVRPSEADEFVKAVARVWASLYTRRAVLSRRAASVPQKDAAMAILVQELLSPDISFVLHTRNPVDNDSSVVQAELALGLGETLASGTRGSPWRLAVSKDSGKVKTLAFANFSEQLTIGGSGAADGTMVHKVADYSKQPLSVDDEERQGLGKRLAAVGQFLEESFGSAQDVEGCVVGSDIYIVQTRPQP